MGDLKRILLVEDSPYDVELSLAALEAAGLLITVDVVRDGVEALDYLYRRGAFSGRLQEDPAVVLLDLKLPRIDGFGVLTQAKNDPSLRQVPVVMLTSSGEHSDVERCYALGVNAYVVKPVDFDAFSRALGELGRFWARLNQPPPSACAA